MAKTLANLADRILSLDHSDEEWQVLKKEFDALVSSATEEELQNFTESGAGEALYMATSSVQTTAYRA
ncbi:MAG: hypothetical protein IKT52_08605 [Oscillospiraceae bacterium]|nr:hypothetical protein [Oscillospiraceae bacterium]